MAGRKKLKEVEKKWKICNHDTKENKYMWDYLPVEIWTQILQRLPVKSLLRCRCVQKSWYYFIQSPLFVTMHSNYQKTHHKYLVAESGLNSLSLRFDDLQFEEYYSIESESDFPDLPNWYCVAADGLICIASEYYHYDSKLCLYNPAIRKIKTLPDPPRPRISVFSNHVMRLAFGFCPKANDFKVVRMVYGKHDDRFTVADVYSLATNSWKDIDNKNGITMGYVGRSDWVFLNDTAFFRGETINNNKENIIVCCDTYKNIMREISLPERCEVDYMDIHCSITLFGNTIALFVKNSSWSGFNMWILKDEVSWEKKISFNLPTIGEWNWDVIGMRNNGEVIVYDLFGDRWMSYNVDKDEAKNFVDCDQWSSSELGWCPPVIRVNSFSESLVLIDT